MLDPVLLVPGLGVPVYLGIWLRYELYNPLRHPPVANLASGRMTIDSDTIGLT